MSENRWVDGLTNEQYHADKEHVSSSGLKLLIEETPDVFYDRIVLGNSKPQTDAMRIGTLVHHAVLEGEDFIKRYVVKPKFDMRTNVGKADSKVWMEEHKNRIHVTEDDIRVLEGTYESIFKHRDAAYLLKGAEFERSGYYRDIPTNVACRIRYDAYDKNSRILTDIKAVRDASKTGFSYALKDYRWDFSMAMYGQGILEIDGSLPDNYVFLVVEKERPFRCAVYEMGKRTLQAGLNDYYKALNILKQCRETGKYPSLQEGLEEIDLPTKFLEEKNV